jgi:hypothetical protein
MARKVGLANAAVSARAEPHPGGVARPPLVRRQGPRQRDSVEVSVDVANTRGMDGDEVVKLYLSRPDLRAGARAVVRGRSCATSLDGPVGPTGS